MFGRGSVQTPKYLVLKNMICSHTNLQRKTIINVAWQYIWQLANGEVVTENKETYVKLVDME